MGEIKYTIKDSLPKNWKELIEEKMGSEGWSIVEMLAEFKISRGVHARFKRDFPEYDEAFTLGETLCEAWWIKQGRENLTNARGYNVGIWCFNMKNRFAWRDTPLGGKEGKAKILPDKVKEAENITKYKRGKNENTTKGADMH